MRTVTTPAFLKTWLAAVTMAAGVALPLSGQADSSAKVRTIEPIDTVRSPISPKRAFLYSLVAPGWAQNLLGRNRAAVTMLGVEAMAIVMIRESGADVRQARRQLGDTLVMSYVDESGTLLAPPTLERRRFEEGEVKSRTSHLEDWVALLVANHLYAAADAFVSASLWDVPAHVAIRGNRNRFTIVARITW